MRWDPGHLYDALRCAGMRCAARRPAWQRVKASQQKQNRYASLPCLLYIFCERESISGDHKKYTIARKKVKILLSNQLTGGEVWPNHPVLSCWAQARVEPAGPAAAGSMVACCALLGAAGAGPAAAAAAAIAAAAAAASLECRPGKTGAAVEKFGRRSVPLGRWKKTREVGRIRQYGSRLRFIRDSHAV